MHGTVLRQFTSVREKTTILQRLNFHNNLEMNRESFCNQAT